MSTRVLSVARGEDLIEALAAACRGGEGWLTATGSVESVEVRVAGEGADPTRTLRGRLTLASLSGPAGGPYGVTLARATDSGLEVLAGELVRARSDGVVVLVLSAGSEAVRDEARRVAAVIAAAPTPAPAAAKAATTSSWASAALATADQRRAAAEPEAEVALPLPGDLVQHFAFGLCEVLMADDERLKIRDVSGPGRLREIHLDMLSIKGPTDCDGKRLFRLERKS